MTNKRILFAGVGLVALLILVSAVAASPVPAGDPLDKIEPELWQTIQRDGKASFIAILAERADTSGAAALPTKREKGEFVYQTLRETADRTQAGLRSYLAGKGVNFKPYYIVNAVLIQANQDVLLEVAARPEVSRLVLNRYFKAIDPKITPGEAQASPHSIEWNISFINADDVWTQYSDIGEGAVIGDLDTGLDYDHPALVEQYRGNLGGGNFDHNYNWWDATTGGAQSVPYDDHGHGTHTMGTTSGYDPGLDLHIGVAYGARTIACKNMDAGGYGQDDWFITCFEFALAPWDLNGQNPNPDLAPDVINNSWGYWGGGVMTFHDVIQSLRDAGVFVEVSAGNEGPACSTLRSPGDYDNEFTTGATANRSETLVWFSSRGPSILFPGVIKPDVVAPGENINSSLPGGGYSGETWSGPSMAGPHVVGTVALIVSVNPGLRGQVATIEQLLRDTAYTGMPNPTDPDSCGGIMYNVVPNYIYGWGRLDALAAVSQIAHVGYLEGHVTDQTTGDPIADAIVSTNLGQSTTTDATGYYTMTLSAGTYDVTATKYLWTSQTVTGTVIVEGATTTQDFQLSPVPSAVVNGTVTDGSGHGWPLYASIDISAPGFNTTIFTNPASGTYSVTLAAGTVHTFVVSAVSGGYNTETRSVTPPATEDFALTVDEVSCSAPGYGPQATYFQDFEANDGGFTVSGGYTSWEWGVPTSGPGSAHSGSNVWATNLEGNYDNYEDGYITSPDIDLSSLAGNSIDLYWWQWLQTESGYDYASVDVSNNGGASWTTVYGPLSGSIDLAWAQHVVTLDSSYAVSNFRVRFHLTTDVSVVYPGWYVDDVAATQSGVPITCAPVPGGLVIGNVYDANTGAGLNGAAVTSLDNPDDTATTFGTPDDPNVADGFYILFSSLTGAHPFQASSPVEGYGTDTRTVNVVADAIAVRNFHLPAPEMSVTPASLEGTAELGLSTQVTMTIQNTGGMTLTWQVREAQDARSRAVIPAAGVKGPRPGHGEWLYAAKTGVSMRTNKGGTALAYPSAYRWTPDKPSQLNILLYADDYIHIAPNTFEDQALQSLGLAYTAHYEGDFYGFESDLNSGSWDFVIFANDNYFPPDTTYTAMNTYVTGGGKLLFHSWTVSSYLSNPLIATLGITWVSDDYDPPDPVYWWDPSHVIFTYPESVPEFTQLTGGIYGIYGQHVEPVAGYTAIAGYTTPGPDPNQAAMVLGNDNRTVYKGFLDGQNDADLDSDGTMDGVELWINLISGIQVEFLYDIPWLSENPTSGTVPPQSTQDVAVTMDAAQLQQPGDYTAALRVNGNDPITPSVTVPVTFHVLPNPDMGEVTGLVTTDRPGGPLEGATVCIVGGFCTETGPDGTYSIFAVAGTYDMTASYTGYITGTATVEILAGQTITQDFELILNAPEMGVSPSSLEATALLGESTQQTLTISNTGVADLVWQITEQQGGQAQMHQVQIPARPEAPENTAAGKAGQTAHSAQTVTIKGLSKPQRPTQINVLLVNADDDNSYGSPIQTMLQAYGDLGAVDLFDARSATPTLSELQAYDVVVTWSNYVYADPVGMGNVLADYVDAGGKVINLMFSMGTHGWQMQGRFMDEGYTAMNGGSILFSTSCLGTYDPGDPIMEGVTDVCDFYRLQGTYLTAGSTAVAYWQDGEIYVAKKDNATVVSIGGYVGYYYMWTGQMADVLHNSILWLPTGGDVVWLSEDPSSGTVPPSSSQGVTVTFDAAQLQQPGDYTAALRVNGNDPITPRVTVPVTFHVLPNPDMGEVAGTVTTDRPGGPLEGATVCIVGGFCTETGADGTYSIFAVAGTYDMTASYTGYLTGTATVEILAGQTITQDFELILNAPEMGVSPSSLEATALLGESTQQTLTISNSGVADLVWQIFEQQGSQARAQQFKTPARPQAPTGAAAGQATSQPQPGGTTASSGAAAEHVATGKGQIHRPGPQQVDVLVLNTTSIGQSVVRALNELGVAFDEIDSESWTGIDFSSYQTVFGTMDGGLVDDVDVQAVREGVVDQGKRLIFLGGTCWQSFALGVNTYLLANDTNNYCWTISASPQWTLVDPSHGLAQGLPSQYDWLNSSAGYYQIRPTDTEAEYVAINGDGYYNFLYKNTYGAGDFIWFTSSVYDGYWGNQGDYDILKQIISNSLTYSADVPWLSEDPTSGTIPPSSSQGVTVTFDAAQLQQPGDYTAALRVNGNDPITPRVTVPVTFHVLPNPDMGEVAGTVTTDRPGGPLEGATVCIVGGFCTETGPDGTYSIFAVAGTYDMTASYTGYLTGTATVEILAGQTITQDFELILDQPEMTVSPDSLEVTVALSTSTQTTVTIGNTGVANLTWQVSEIPSGLTRAMLRIGSAPVRRVSGQVSPLWVGRHAIGSQVGPLPLAPNDPPWTNIANYPVSIMDSTAAEWDGLVYSVGGYDGFSILNTGYVYDPVSDSWSPIASMSFTREKPAAAFVDGLLYVVGGWDSFGTPVTTLEIYDPSTNTWSTGAPVPTAYASSPAVALNGEIYVIGGCDSFYCGYTSVYRYDPASNTWSTVASYPEEISWNHCAAIAGQIYCAGGTTSFAESDSTYVYDPGTDTWTALASMPQTQWAGGYIGADGLLYVSGGVTNNFSTITNEGFAYDPGTDTWTQIENSNNTVYRGASACGFYRIGGSIGGFTPIPNSEVYPGLTNCGGITDIPWLSEDPTSGTVPPGGSQEVTVTFDAAQVPSTGVYSGTLRVSGNDPYNRRVDIPVTMIVVEAGYGVQVEPPTAAQTGHPNTTLTYELQVTNLGTLPDTFDVTVSGNTWTTTAPATIGPLNPGETATLTVTVDIPPDAADGATDVATVTVTSQADPTKSASSVLTSTSVFYQLNLPIIIKN